MKWYQMLGISIDTEDIRSMNMKTLKAHRKTIVDGMRKALDSADLEKRDLSEQEAKAFDQGHAHLDEINDEIEHRPSNYIPGLAGGGTYRGDGHVSQEKPVFGGIGLSYRQLFYQDENANLDNSREAESFLRDVIEKRTMISGSGASGGFTVPEYWWSSIYQSVLNQSICLPRVRMFPMESSTLHISAWDSEDRSDDAFIGGVSAEWVGENSSFTVKTPAVRSITLTSQKCGLFTNCSREVLEDSNSLANSIGPLLTTAVAQAFDNSCINGTGIGQPQGLINSPSTIQVSRTTSNDILYADLVSMITKILPNLLTDAVWICSSGALEKLLLMQDSAGSYVWRPGPSSGAEKSVPSTLLGRPIFVSDKAAALGSTGDIMLAAWSAFAFGMRKNVSLESTIAASWLKDVVDFRAIMRGSGVALLDNAVTMRNGDELSWASVLE